MKKRNYYTKASEYFEKGLIYKALEECEKGINENLKNSSLLNLKGIILYLKGDLQGATSIWKINKDFNNDSMSKGYLNDSKKDEEKDLLFSQGKQYLKELRIGEALEIFLTCKETSYNSINVDTAIALCYMKKGEFEKASEYVERVLKVDVKNKTALDIKKDINESIKNNNINYKKIAILLVLSVGILISINFIVKKINNTQNGVNSNAPIVDKRPNDTSIVDKSEEENNALENKEKNIDLGELKQANKEKEYLKVHNLIKEIRDISILSNDEKREYSKGLRLLENKGVEYFYKKGSTYLENKDFKNSSKYLDMAYIYGKGNYLFPHIVYFNGLAKEELGELDIALEFYKEYRQAFPKGDYIEECLYKLALLHIDINKSLSKKYAKDLVKKYPNSMYNNTIIKEIIGE